MDGASVDRAPEYSVLFVCTANQCRSPMAEALWRARIEVEGESDRWKIGSAGTWTVDGAPAMRYSKDIMAERGLDLTHHQSRIVDRDMVDAYNLVLVMTANHKEAMQTEFRDRADRIFLISEMIGRAYDVRDPVAGTVNEYRATAQELARMLDEGAERIRDLASGA